MGGAPIVIEPMDRAHWERVREIYAEGIAEGQATFETSAPGWREWDDAHLPECRVVAILGGVVAGWAALTPYSSRDAYAGVAEVSVYVDAAHRGRGVGTALLERVIADSEDEGFWTLQGGVFPENQASVALCEKLGFREVGVRKRIGKLDGVWRDVVLLERRSPAVGAG